MDAPERDLRVSGRFYDDESVTRACKLFYRIIPAQIFSNVPTEFQMFKYSVFLSFHPRLPTSRPTTFETHRSCCAAYR
jgi:hypothetical protein